MPDEKKEKISESVAEAIGINETFLLSLVEHEWIGIDGKEYDANQVEVFLKKVKHGVTKELASECAGIPICVIDDWIKQKGKDHYGSFSACFHRFTAEAESQMIISIHSNGAYNAQSAILYLQIIKPDKYTLKPKDNSAEKEPIRTVVIKEGFDEP